LEARAAGPDIRELVVLRTLITKTRLWLIRRKYRPGRLISQFLAPDVRRDVEIVDVSLIESGIISARVRTWNVLYEARGLAPQSSFSEVQEIEIKNLWHWSGEPWGGPIPDPTDK
jgi:hypothetical protein